jgi:hypothetical protein
LDPGREVDRLTNQNSQLLWINGKLCRLKSSLEARWLEIDGEFICSQASIKPLWPLTEIV